MFINIINSLLKTVTVSVVIALIAQLLFKQDAVMWFVVSFLGQFVLFYMWNSYVSYKLNLDINRQETERIKAFESQGVDVKCAHCNSVNYIPIRMDEDNGFECAACDKTNAVYVDVTVAQQTEFIDKRKVFNTITEGKEDATDERTG